MFFQSSLVIIALASTTSEGFAPLASQRQSNKFGILSSTKLLDSEQPSIWNADEWNGGVGSSTMDNFLPSKEEMKVAGKIMSKKRKDDAAAYQTKLGIEKEYPTNKRKVRASVKETGHDSMKNYIKSMCNHELLNKNEEIILAREIQVLLKWEEQREQLEEQLLR
jgi:hypothetical protein